MIIPSNKLSGSLLFSKLRSMRITELRRRMAEHFGADWAPSYAKDFVMAELGGQTVDQALAMGMEPADIWRAVVKNNPDISNQLK
jgi:uncharacterized protein (DUF697 family)